MEMIL